MKQIIALQEYSDKYISLYQGQIRNVETELANRLIEQGIVAEHNDSDSGSSGDEGDYPLSGPIKITIKDFYSESAAECYLKIGKMLFTTTLSLETNTDTQSTTPKITMGEITYNPGSSQAKWVSQHQNEFFALADFIQKRLDDDNPYITLEHKKFFQDLCLAHAEAEEGNSNFPLDYRWSFYI